MANKDYSSVLKMHDGTLAIWISIELTDSNYDYLFPCVNRMRAKMTPMVFTLLSDGNKIHASGYGMCEKFELFDLCIPELNKLIVPDKTYFACFTDFDQNTEREGYADFLLSILPDGHKLAVEEERRIQDVLSLYADFDKLPRRNIREKRGYDIRVKYTNPTNGYPREIGIYSSYTFNCEVVNLKKQKDYRKFHHKMDNGDKLIMKLEGIKDDMDIIGVYWKGIRIGDVAEKDVPLVVLNLENGELEAEVIIDHDDDAEISYGITFSNFGNPEYEERYGPYKMTLEFSNGRIFGAIPITIEQFKEKFYYE